MAFDIHGHPEPPLGSPQESPEITQVAKQVQQGVSIKALPSQFELSTKQPQSPLPPGPLEGLAVALSFGPKRVELTAEEFMNMAKEGKAPPNATVRGNISLRGLAHPLPEGLHIEGDLRLLTCALKSLPPGLQVTGSLYLSNSKPLESLSEGLKVGHLALFGCSGLSSLPNDLIAKTVAITDTKITLIPKGVGAVVSGFKNLPPEHIATLSLPEDQKALGGALRELATFSDEAKKIIFGEGSPWKEHATVQAEGINGARVLAMLSQGTCHLKLKDATIEWKVGGNACKIGSENYTLEPKELHKILTDEKITTDEQLYIALLIGANDAQIMSHDVDEVIGALSRFAELPLEVLEKCLQERPDWKEHIADTLGSLGLEGFVKHIDSMTNDCSTYFKNMVARMFKEYEAVQMLSNVGGSSALSLQENLIAENPQGVMNYLANVVKDNNLRTLFLTLINSDGTPQAQTGAYAQTKQVLYDLFANVLNDNEKFQKLPNGLLIPYSQAMSDSDRELYNSLGMMLMFCLNSNSAYPIPDLLDKNFFVALTQLRNEHLDQNLDDLLANDETKQQLTNIYNILGSDQDVKLVLEALIEIARGMREAMVIPKIAWKDLQNINPAELQRELVHDPLLKDAIADVARRFVNFSLRSKISDQQEGVMKTYQGQQSTTAFITRQKYAQEFRKRSEEVESLVGTAIDAAGLERICRHRENMLSLINMSRSVAPRFLVDCVNSLSDPKATTVVTLQDGTKTFSMHGGYVGHSMTYEIKMQTDKDGQDHYFFVIHNRNGGDRDPELQGELALVGSDKVYLKTTVPIEVNKAALSEQFFRELINSIDADNMEIGYSCIKTHLLQTGGKLQRSADETCMAKLFELESYGEKILDAEANDRGELENAFVQLWDSMSPQELASLKAAQGALAEHFMSLRSRNLSFDDQKLVWGDVFALMQPAKVALMERLITADTNFHSAQTFGTCTESNSTGPEKAMADKGTQDLLRLFTIRGLAEEVRASTLPARVKEELAPLGELRQSLLQSKIIQENPYIPAAEAIAALARKKLTVT